MSFEKLDEEAGVTLTRRIVSGPDGKVIERKFVVEAAGEAFPIFEDDNEGKARLAFRDQVAKVTRSK